ncbi:MAG: alpha/beta hydrolase [Candidatus Binatia bacterium]|nr:alpha/beta hydrolase [Candidatus Binatia bacterium]
MKRVLKRVGLALGAIVGLVAAVTYSWTITPQGRLDYGAAVVSKLASWQTGPQEYTPEARAGANEMVRGFLPGEPAELARGEDRDAVFRGHHVPVRVYWPELEGPLPLYLDIHGGGWWMGDGYPFEKMTTRFAAASGAIVVSVDYRLAPEHPYPAAIDDVWAALNWMHANAAGLGGDPERIAIGGSSAGGNLAAALALRARDEDGPEVSFQYLLVPATDLSGTTDWASFDEAGEEYVLKVSGIATMIDAYVPDAGQRSSAYISPLLAQDHRGLPPALIVTAQYDPLRDQGAAYAEKLRAAGVPVQYHEEPNSIHGFLGSPERAERIQALGAEALRNAFAAN